MSQETSEGTGRAQREVLAGTPGSEEYAEDA